MKKNKTGFTLIELLIVISIIGVLSSVVISSLKTAREKARDAQRLSDVKQIQTALEMFYNEKGYYPKKTAYTYPDSGCGGSSSWCNDIDSLKKDLAPYLPKLPLKSDSGFTKDYYYNSDSGDNYQSYGFMTSFESDANSSKEQNDGGYLNYMYEIGEQPKYCMSKYTGADAYWWSTTNVCVGGN